MRPEKTKADSGNLRPPYGGSALRAYMVTAAPVGAAGRQGTKGDASPFNPLIQCSSVIVVDARF